MGSFDTTLLDRALRRKRQEREKLRRETIQKLKRAVSRLAKSYGIERVFLFGSAIKPGRFHERSDVDVAVSGLANEDYFSFMAALSRTIKRDVDVVQLENAGAEKLLRKPAIAGGKQNLAYLQVYVREQIEAIHKIYRKIIERKDRYTKDEKALDSLAYQLHNLYCSFEYLFRIIADHFENHLTDTIGWHTELLKRMKIQIDGVRPALISESTYNLLDELRGFRHVFRHAYGKELDPVKIKIVLQKALALRKVYKTNSTAS